jgi:hypothetical protein
MGINRLDDLGAVIDGDEGLEPFRERRGHERYRLGLPVVATIGGRRRRLQTLDVGAQGVFLINDSCPEVWDPVVLTFIVSDDEPFDRQGVVVRCVSPEEAAKQGTVAGMAVEFFGHDEAWMRLVAPPPSAPPPSAPPLESPSEDLALPEGPLTTMEGKSSLDLLSRGQAIVSRGQAIVPGDEIPAWRMYRVTPPERRAWQHVMEQFSRGGGLRLRGVSAVPRPTMAVVVLVDPELTGERHLPCVALPPPGARNNAEGVVVRFSPVVR